GCTGGRHRSVFIAEKLGTWLDERASRVDVRHRELQDDTPGSSDNPSTIRKDNP
ncbi:MAG: hypothetical protein O7A62_01360, partial [Alphaproteobacteria bacterium]|nr:hypothetical protein [Alphaproteobacteria bacterium]